MWPWSRRRSEADFAAEIEAHIALEVDRLIDEGMAPDEATRTAHRKFGNVTATRERFHERGPRRWFDQLGQDVRYTVRSLGRSRAFTAVAVLTLAVGIGATTAIFGVVDAVLLRPLPYANPDALVTIAPRPLGFTPPDVAEAWRDRATSLDDIAGFRALREGRLTVGHESKPVDWVEVTWNLPAMLGATPVAGRSFVAADMEPGSAPVVMLSYELWNGRFAADPSIPGRALALDGEPVTVIGVLDASFRFPSRGSALPATALIAAAEPGLLRVPQGNEWFSTIGRLAPGVAPAEASTELRALFEQAEHGLTQNALERVDLTVTPLHEQLVADVREPILLVMGASAFVLLLVCANVANLLLARTSARQRELALRGALGAGRARLAGLLVTESLLLALAGAVVGLPIAVWIGETARLLLAEHVSHVHGIAVNWRLAAFALAGACASGLATSLAALVRIRSVDPVAALAGTARVTARPGLARAALLAGELAAAFVLVVGAALMLQTLSNLTASARTFDTDRLITMRVSADTEADFLEDWRLNQQQTVTFFADLLRRVEAVPGVVSAAAASHLPLTRTSVGTGGISLPELPAVENASASFAPLSPGYFQTLGIPLVAGREFDGNDRAGSAPVVMVNQAFAELYAPGHDLTGLQLHVDGWMATIVGIARDVPVSLRESPTPVIFAPLLQLAGRPFGFQSLTVIARVHDGIDPATLATRLQNIAWAAGAGVAVDRVGTMASRVHDAVEGERDLALLLSLFGALALLIAAIGVYGVAAYSTVQRTSEIGIRIALGARRIEIARLVLAQILRPSLVGLIAGIAAAAALSRVIAANLFGIDAVDPGTYASAGVVLVAVALGASWIPARRATVIDPLTAVRHE